MTNTTSTNKPANAIHINIRKACEDFPVDKLLAEVVTAWERGRNVIDIQENGSMNVSCDTEHFSVATQKTLEHMIKFAGAVLEEVLPQVSAAYFSSGIEHGRNQRLTPVAPREKTALNTQVAAPVDSAAITKSIAEELKKMFNAGFEQGKAGGNSGSTPRVVRALHTVQRDRQGDISASVTNYQYEDAPGVNPPPL